MSIHHDVPKVSEDGGIPVNLFVWIRNAVVRISPPVFTIAVLVDVVTKVDDIVDRVLSHRISVRIKKSKRFSQDMVSVSSANLISEDLR